MIGDQAEKKKDSQGNQQDPHDLVFQSLFEGGFHPVFFRSKVERSL
jgi:hypothetical protein